MSKKKKFLLNLLNRTKTTVAQTGASPIGTTVHGSVGGSGWPAHLWNTAPRKLREDLSDHYQRAISAFDIAQLKKRIVMDIKKFPDEAEKMGGQLVTDDLTGQAYIFIDNHADILCVAHLDCVHYEHKVGHAQEKGLGDVYYAIEVDDRVGAYVILDLLPKLGVKADILLTEGEESGMSSAASFKAPEGKEYKWIFEFDRRQDDAVMYQYETKELASLLKEHDFFVGMGTYSDIAYLDHLGVSAFNFGSGYYDEHTRNARVSPMVMLRQVARFMSFYEAHKGDRFKYEDKGYVGRYYGGYASYYRDGMDNAFGEWPGDYDDTQDTSADDHFVGWKVNEKFVCPRCGGEVRKAYGSQSKATCPGCKTPYYKLSSGSTVYTWGGDSGTVGKYTLVGNTVSAAPSNKCCKCGSEGVFYWKDSESMSFKACQACGQLHVVLFVDTGNYMLEAPHYFGVCPGCGGGVINIEIAQSHCPVCEDVFTGGKPVGNLVALSCGEVGNLVAGSGEVGNLVCYLCNETRQDSTHFIDDPESSGRSYLCHSCYAEWAFECPGCGNAFLGDFADRCNSCTDRKHGTGRSDG